MAVKSYEDLMENLNTILGERNDDESLEFIQDMTDTFKDMDSKRGDYTKQQYDELDASWRKRYRERFFSGSANDTPTDSPDDDSDNDKDNRSTSVQIKDLFSKK